MNKANKGRGKARFFSPKGWKDYQLLDHGHGQKLERFGDVILIRPESLAKGKPNLSKQKWQEAHWRFVEERGQKGNWQSLRPAPKEWEIGYSNQGLNLKFQLQLSAYKHIGLFPEQAANWAFLHQHLKGIERPKVLNLFAYTGAATLAARAAGAEVTHVDAVKQVVNWGKTNAQHNGWEDIRWIVDDAKKYVERAQRRGLVYNAIVMDPPAFGIGGGSQNWKLERDLKALVELCMPLLDRNQSLFVLNTYSPRLSLFDLKQLLATVKGFPKKYESGILGLTDSNSIELPLGCLIRFRSGSFFS